MVSFMGTNEPRHDKNQQSDFADSQADQSLRCVLNGWLRIQAFFHADSKDSDQTGRMPRLIWVFTGCTLILLVLSCHYSFLYQAQ